MENNMNFDLLEVWQQDYDRCVGEGGKVIEVFGNLDKRGCLTFNVVVENKDKRVEYCFYFNQSPFDGCTKDTEYLTGEVCCCMGCSFEADEEVWVDSIMNVMNWDIEDWENLVE